MRWQHHPLCVWFRPNLASPGAATWEVNIIVFVCGLHQTSLQRKLLHEKSKLSSLHVVYTNPCFTWSCYMRRQHHHLCMWLRPTLASPGTITWEVKFIVCVCGLCWPSLHREILHGKSTSSSFVCGLDQTSLHWEQLYEKKTSSYLYVV